MTISFPYVNDKFTAYLDHEGGITTNLSLAIWLIDAFTGKSPVVPLKVMVKESNKKMIKNRSGYYLFNDLGPGKYTIVVDSEYYFLEERICDTSKYETLDQNDNYKKLVERGRLEFDTLGPGPKAKSIILKDVYALRKQEDEEEEGDAIELRNPSGEVEHRTIQEIDTENRTIFWDEELKHDFSVAESRIRALKVPIIEVQLKPRPEYPFPDNATLVKGMVVRGMVESNSKPVVGAVVKLQDKTAETKTVHNGDFVLFIKGKNSQKIFKDKKRGEKVGIDIVITNGKEGEADTIKAEIEEGKSRYIGNILLTP